ELERFKPTETSPLREAWHLAPEHYAFGVVGSYDLPRGKGQREFLQAAARIKDTLPHARFLIVGSGSLLPTLQADIQSLGLQDRAQILPWCNDMPAAMNALDCLVHPQVGTEALGGVILEAHACGRPVVATAVDGIPEAFRDGGLGRLIPTESIDALATAMIETARESRLSMAERLSLHERVAAKSSTESACRNFERLYRSLPRLRDRNSTP
ncbi:MAG TPA: glycosyl transferase, partial [Verrucomicrobiales bacterium]|nr:glycosyl transferase [Verrucomicrobiales bacterium]